MITVRLEGMERLLKQFEKMGPRAKREGTRAMRATAEAVRSTAIRSMQSDSKTGTTYLRGKGQNLSTTHQASAPGQSPAVDTGGLIRSARVEARDMSATLVFGAEYASDLEYGTTKMAARPFLAPAIQANQNTMRDEVLKSLKNIIES
jgi:HK97 gp10 family phage protein